MPAGYSMDETLRIAERMEKGCSALVVGRDCGDRLSTVSFSLLIPVALLPTHRLSIRHALRICVWY